MSNCQSCPSNGNCNEQNKNNIDKPQCSMGNIKNIIGIMSGKGGVGKSTVTALIASELRDRGFSVGILDADITGPSIPRLFGVEDRRPTMGGNSKINPVEGENGIKIMSMNLLMEEETQPVLWRGPMIAGAVKQFWTDVVWGDLDFLLVDMPPGTGDVPLTVAQTMPLTGVVMVSTPQSMVSMIVAKAVNMANKMGIKVLGVVENMSYIVCPGCSEKIEMYGNNAANEAAADIGIPLLGELPMDTELMNLANRGSIENYAKSKNDFKAIVDKMIREINV